MKFLFDTDHLSVLQRPLSADYLILTARTGLYQQSDFAASIVSFHEQVIGCHALLNRARRDSELIRGYEILEDILRGYSKIIVLPYDAAAIATFDKVAPLKPRTATMDLRIAATAVTHGLTLLSRNRADFAGIPGLIVEDWTV